MKHFIFNTTRSIVNEPGAKEQLADICRAQRIERPLIVTDAGIVSLGMLQPIVDLLQKDGLQPEIFADVVADPPDTVVLNAVQVALEAGCDGVVGFGGGSSMDTAKLIALLARSGENLVDIYGVGNAKGQRLPLILIPTTAGTGSEVTAVAIVTTGETTKAGVVAPQLLPDVALLDAELTLGLPPHITAATGIDAMVHAIEAYTSAQLKNPYSDMLAREALRLMAGNIRTAVHRGDNLAARQAMLLGACMAGQAFANSPVAAVHALAYPLGGHYHIPHGLSNSLVLPHVMRFNSAAAGALYAQLAPLMFPGFSFSANVDTLNAQLVENIEGLIEELQLPNKLSALNVPESDLPMLAEDAMLQQRLLVYNPREVCVGDALAIYQAAY